MLPTHSDIFLWQASLFPALAATDVLPFPPALSAHSDVSLRRASLFLLLPLALNFVINVVLCLYRPCHSEMWGFSCLRYELTSSFFLSSPLRSHPLPFPLLSPLHTRSSTITYLHPSDIYQVIDVCRSDPLARGCPLALFVIVIEKEGNCGSIYA